MRRAWDLVSRTSADEVIASLLLAWVVFLSLQRLRYGVDFYDESFAVAITQRYALGDRPYVDELNLRQTAHLLPAVFYSGYLKLVGSTDGVVHFLRVLYFLVQCGVAFAVYQLAARRLPRGLAIVAAAMPIAFVPFTVPMCNYNNLGTMTLCLGTFIGLRALLDDPRPRTMIVAGVFFGIACVSYPPLLVPVVAFGVAVVFVSLTRRESEPWWKPIFHMAIGLAIVGLPFAIIMGPSGVAGLRHALHYEGMTTRPRTMDKVRGVMQALVQLSPGSPSTLTTLAVAGVLAKQVPAARRYVVAGLVVFLAYWFNAPQPEHRGLVPIFTLSLHLTIYLGLVAGLFCALLKWSHETKVLLVAGWLPSVVGGLIMAIASDNVGCMNGGLGLFPAATLAMILAPLAARRDTDASRADTPGTALSRIAGVAIMATVPISMMLVNVAVTYSDGPIGPEWTTVATGPFRGMRAPPAKVANAEELTRELRGRVRPGDHMLSFYDFPGAYLSVPSRPGLQTVWTDHRARLSVILPYWESHRTGEGIVLNVNGHKGASPELEALALDPSRLIVDRGWFRLYREPPPP